MNARFVLDDLGSIRKEENGIGKANRWVSSPSSFLGYPLLIQCYLWEGLGQSRKEQDQHGLCEVVQRRAAAHWPLQYGIPAMTINRFKEYER